MKQFIIAGSRNARSDTFQTRIGSQSIQTNKQALIVLGHGFETARCAGYAAILTPVAASGSRPFCSALI
jgi:hypothetical protein